jgi:two-component system chemotaxis response regulator CheY
MKVLIVDDNVEMRRLLRTLVARLVEAVYECEDGAEVVEAYAARQLTADDWVLMDIEMPRVNGLEATRQLKNIWPDARVCIVTGDDRPQLRKAAQTAGASDFIAKENLCAVRRLLQSV